MKQQVNLNNAPELDEHDVDQLVRLLGARCRDAKLRRLRSMLTYGRHALGNYGIYNRVIKENGVWSYCAGQSYTDEIRTVRELITKG